ncbi:hypothetical protein MIDIC_110094 [Alphaproteobacteria bacterium]
MLMECKKHMEVQNRSVFIYIRELLQDKIFSFFRVQGRDCKLRSIHK